jgi:hypothetical protein
VRKTVKVTDLTQAEGDPGSRADVRREVEPLESCTVELRMPAWLGGGTVTLDTKTLAGSRLADAITTFLVVAAGCLALGALTGASAAGAHVPSWAIIGSLLAPAVIYTTISITNRPSKK